MDIVIKIDDKLYDLIKHYERSIENIEEENDTLEITLMRAIINGIPLPKGHGDLIDRSKIGKAIPAEEDNCTGFGMTYDEMDAYNDGIDSMYDKVQRVEPIIEAYKEVSNGISD